jgi:transposase-like protein
VLKCLHYPLDVILTCVRWYVAYPLSIRHLKDMMAERGVTVDHSTVHRWAIKLLPGLSQLVAQKRERRQARMLYKAGDGFWASSVISSQAKNRAASCLR